MESKCNNPLAKQLSICGQVAEHKSQKMQEHGSSDDTVMDALSEEEKKLLSELLSKLQGHWIEDHKAHHKNQ